MAVINEKFTISTEGNNDIIDITKHVKNCVYHTMNDSCKAGTIKVGNSTANCCSETCCDTFEAKN